MKTLPDSISIEWHFSDVQEVDNSLTKTEAKQVLNLLKKYHDANVGINWEVIEATIGIFKRYEHLKFNEIN